MKKILFSAGALIILMLLLTACQTDVCGSNTATQISDPTVFSALTTPTVVGSLTDTNLVKIGGRMIEVNRVIQGPLCNDTWSGTIYVACNVQVAEWVDNEHPTFLKNCDLNIEPGTIVYVAAHNNAAYFNGCSCHTGEESK